MPMVMGSNLAFGMFPALLLLSRNPALTEKKRDPMKRCLVTLSGWTFDLLTDCPQAIWRRKCVLFCGTFVPILNCRWTRGRVIPFNALN